MRMIEECNAVESSLRMAEKESSLPCVGDQNAQSLAETWRLSVLREG